MPVKIIMVDKTEDNQPVFEAIDLSNNEPVECKNWFEKSKDKWHIVLGKNSANRKYLAHNEFFAKAENNEYIVEDRTTPPRQLGTAQPDRKLVPFMTEEDKAAYDEIIARAIKNREAQKNVELTEEEKLERQIAKLQAKLAKAQAQAQAKSTQA